MALIEIHLKPSQGQLKCFGVVVLVFFGLIGGLVYTSTRSMAPVIILWSMGAALCVLYYGVRPLRVPFFLAWMYVAFPIGWTISHLMLAVIYYLILTPIGLGMRRFGHDPMQRRLDRNAKSYWLEHRTGTNLARYFRQF